MSLDFMSDLRCLVLLDGTVFGNVDNAAAHQPMEIRLGEALTPFESCDVAPVEALQSARPYRLDTRNLATNSHSLPAEDIPGEVYACWVNHLEDWAMSGCQTVQLMINRFQAPCQIFIENRLTVPVVQEGMVFQACLASHRAAATLCVTFKDPQTQKEERHFLPFDTNYPGGPLRDGYAEVRQPIPTYFESCEISLEIEYRELVPDDKGTEPFLFLADVQVRQVDQGNNSQLLAPEWIYGNAPAHDGTWVRAPLPNALSPGQDLTVQIGHDIVPISPLPAPRLTVRENYGHTLICEADQDMELVLNVDGQHVQAIHVTAGDNVIRLPNRYLNGHVRLLSIKDRSGSVTLFEQHQLLPFVTTPVEVMHCESAAPYLSALQPQTRHRYEGLKAVMAAAGPETDFDQLTHALETLEGGPENVVAQPLCFPSHAEPEVSIIIPAHNQFAYTYLTLCSLLVGHNRTSFEVIVVDDASSDETRDLEDLVDGITVIRHPNPQRFIRACNAGAERARGKYIALLNNDVEVTAGWLDALVDGLNRFDQAGLVGSKLLYPNGDLQEAGGIVWGSGNPWNYGNHENPMDPRFCYARQADYLSGAALLLSKEVWHQIRGLSAYLEPMYFEDTDLAFKVRAAGFGTWFIPSSVVYHYEGVTSGTDVKGGFKKYQEINRPKFKRQWATAFRNCGSEGANPNLEKDRGIVGRVLFIDHAPPRADKDAGSYAAIQEMRLVQSLGYKVTFVSTNMAHLGSYTEALQNDGIEVIYAPFFMNPSEYLDQHAAEFDAFYITRYYVAKNVLDKLRQRAPGAKVLFNNADLHFLRELRAARNSGDADQLDRARQTRMDELDIIRNVDVILSYNDVEHSVIQAYTDGTSNVVKCPWVVDVPDSIPAASSRAGLSFLGSFAHHPNTEGVQWFCRAIMPRLTTLMPDTTLSIYGSGMSAAIFDLESPHINPVGFVENVGEAYHPHRIFVAPLLSGAGIKGKVINALAHGIPCVISPFAAEGIGLRSGYDCFIAEKPEEWIAAISRLTTDEALWETMSQNARRYMHSGFSFEKGRALMRAAFEAADMYGSKP